MPSKTAKAKYHHAWSTAWGPVGAASTDRGLCGFFLPHYQLKDLFELLAWEHAGSVRSEEPFVELIELTRAYFNGQPADFQDVQCDLPAESSFGGKVLRACRRIGYGCTTSYGALARDIGKPDAARAVATAMGKNPIPLIVPCHRITYSNGRAGGFSAPGGVQLKQKMLTLESGHQGG